MSFLLEVFIGVGAYESGEKNYMKRADFSWTSIEIWDFGV